MSTYNSCVDAWPSSLSLNYRCIEFSRGKRGGSFTHSLQKCPEKCPIKLDVYWILKKKKEKKKRNSSSIYCGAFGFSPAGWIISAWITCLSASASCDSVPRCLIARARGIFPSPRRNTNVCKSKTSRRGKRWCHSGGQRSIFWFIGRCGQTHPQMLTHTHTRLTCHETTTD